MTVFSGHYGGAAGARQGVAAVVGFEKRSLVGYPVDVRSRGKAGKFGTIGTDCFLGMVVGHDKKNVGGGLLRFILRMSSRKREQGKYCS